VILCACSEEYADDHKESQKQELINKISIIANQNLNYQVYTNIEVVNYLNPYEKAGIITHNSMLKAVKNTLEKKNSVNSIYDEFLEFLNEELPENLVNLETDNLDPIEIQIEEILLKILVKEGFDSYITKSIFIENIIIDNDYMNCYQKKRILVFSSVLRHVIVGMKDIHNEYGDSKGEWKDCFLGKLEKLSDCEDCYIEKAWCVFTWPQCLTFKAIDCVIDVIIN